MDRKTLIVLIVAAIVTIGGGIYFLNHRSEVAIGNDSDPVTVAQINSVRPMGLINSEPKDRLSQYLQGAIDSKTANWGDLVVIMPGVFSEGQTRDSVEAMLFKAQFAPTTLENFSWRQKYDFDAGSDLYRLKFKAGGCTLQNSVMIRFDDSDRLISAKGLQDELGCS